ncbi:unnamed protein product [Meloidogyne enterolobii]|uniref:Uncharacterized protein n=1 Tax=Meloidogyne enterolobii TaxID=390850 RepID=A0ACB1AVF3_MELEN
MFVVVLSLQIGLFNAHCPNNVLIIFISKLTVPMPYHYLHVFKYVNNQQHQQQYLQKMF